MGSRENCPARPFSSWLRCAIVFSASLAVLGLTIGGFLLVMRIWYEHCELFNLPCNKANGTQTLQFARFDGHRNSFSYFALPPASSFASFSIKLDFRPETENGLILFIGNPYGLKGAWGTDNGIALAFSKRQVVVSFNVGGVPIFTNASHKHLLELHRWHNLDLERREDNLTLILNGCKSVPLNMYRSVDIRSDLPTSSVPPLFSALYIGGFPQQTNVIIQQSSNFNLKQGFTGCFGELYVNASTYDVFGKFAKNTGVEGCYACSDASVEARSNCNSSKAYQDSELQRRRCRERASENEGMACDTLCATQPEGPEALQRAARDIHSVSRKTVLLGVGQLPYIGSVLKEVLEHCWPEKAPDLWSTVEKKVIRLVDSKIADYESQARQADLFVLRDLMTRYVAAGLTQKAHIMTSLSLTCTKMFHYINGSSSRHHVLPQIWLLSNIHEIVLKEHLTFNHVLYPETESELSSAYGEAVRELAMWLERYDQLKSAAYEEWLVWTATEMVTVTTWVGRRYWCTLAFNFQRNDPSQVTVTNVRTGEVHVYRCDWWDTDRACDDRWDESWEKQWAILDADDVTMQLVLRVIPRSICPSRAYACPQLEDPQPEEAVYERVTDKINLYRQSEMERAVKNRDSWTPEWPVITGEMHNL